MLHRIQKILASAGIGSRRACECLIAEGRVKVNGKLCKLGDKADPETGIITVDGKAIPKPEKNVYVMLNKPFGVVTTVRDKFAHKTVLDIVKVKERVFPVGRLDQNSEGLLLLTNDGLLTYALTHPSKGVSKTYRVSLDRPIISPDTKRLIEGIKVDERLVAVEKLRRLSKNEVEIKIHEGRKHIVRKLFKKLGYVTVKLMRISFGPLRLAGLKPGQWKYLSKEEVEILRKKLSER